MNGWAFEARLYAENPAAGYLPSTGRLEHLSLPESVRVDSGVEQGDDITAFYDPMIAKIIAHGPNREAALSKLAAACASIEVWPVKSNAGLLARIAVDPDFRAARIDTGFLDRHGLSLGEMRLFGVTGGVRRNGDIGQCGIAEGTIRRQRLVVKDIESRLDAAGADLGEQSRLVDQLRARRVDEQRAGV